MLRDANGSASPGQVHGGEHRWPWAWFSRSARREWFPVRQVRVRPLACFAVAFLLGLIIANRFRLPLWLGIAGCVAALAAAIALRCRNRRFATAMMLLGLCLGVVRMSLALWEWPPIQTRYSVEMVGRVASDPFVNPDSGRVIARFEPETVAGEPSDLALRLYLRGDEAAMSPIAYGQRLRLTGHIWQNDPTTNPYEFDFAQWLHRNGMNAIATAKIEDVEILGKRQDWQSPIVSVRRAIGARIDALFPESAGMVRALVLGDRSLLSEEMRERLNATGTAHLIAISGLHVTVLAFALSAVLGLWLPRRRANLLTLLPLLFYGALIGLSAPFARALMMFAVFSFAPIAGLPSDSVTRLASAMLAWLILRPMDIADSGFVLSYTASAGILMLIPPLLSLFRVDRLLRRVPSPKRHKRVLRAIVAYIPTLLCASLAAQLSTLPAVIASFGVQSIVSLPFNLICVPLCMAGYICALAVLVASAVFMPLGMLAARVPEALFHALSAVTRLSGALPLTAVHIGRYPWPLVLLHAAVCLASSAMSRIRLGVRRWLPLTLAVVAALSSLVAWLSAWPFSVTFLDAGEADCAILCTRGHTYVFDAGDTYTPAGDYLSATCLHVDGVFLSHPHQDHAGGLADILVSFTPDAVYVPPGWFEAEDISPAVTEGIELARSKGVQIVELSTGDTFPLSGDATLSVWSPDIMDEFSEINDMSLLLKVECGGKSVLFTGDLPIAGEPETVPECDVLKVAHHGADNATSVEFLAQATPEIAVISVGENSFGHPGEYALERIESSGAQILRTDQCGAIRLVLRGGTFHIDTYREAPDDLE